MADEKALNPEVYRKIGEDATGILTSLNDITKIIGDNAKKLEDLTGDSAESFEVKFSSAKKLAGELKGISANDLKDRDSKKKLDQKVLAVEKELLANKRKQRELALRSKTASGKEKALLKSLVEFYSEGNISTQAQLNSTKSLYEELKRIDNDVQLYDDIADIVGDIPVLNKVFKDFAAASKKAREASADGKASFKEAAGEYTKAASKALQIFAVGKVYKGLMLGNELTTEFARNLNTSAASARELRDQVLQVSISTQGLANAKDYAEIITQTSKTFGVVANLSKSQLQTMGLLSKELGLSAESAQNLLKVSILTDKDLKSQTNSIVGQTLLANSRNKVNIRYQDILNDISSTSTATLLTLQKFPGGVQRAAYETRRFGLSLANVSKISEGLLDFESSISAELEAELLTGKQLNLERARMAALTGDTATLAREIAANFGTADEFSRMNVIQQNALAKAVGMSRDELGEVYAQQAAINKLSKVEGATLNDKVKTQQLEIQRLREKGDIAKANSLEQQLINDLGDTELRQQIENKSATEATKRAMESLGEAAGTLSTILEPVAKIITAMGQGASFLLKLFLKIKAAAEVIGKLFKGSAGKEVAKTAGKSAGKLAAKRIPGIGALVGLGFAYDKLKKEDVTGATMELFSSALSLIDFVAPSAGTASSLGMDAIIARRDYKRGKEGLDMESQTETPLATGGIVTQPTRALIGEAGSEAVIPLREFYAKMDEMIAAVKEGKTINLDGRRVNEGLFLATSKFDRR